MISAYKYDGKGVKFVGESMTRKQVLTDSSMLHHKVMSLHEDFSKGSPEMSDTKPFIAK